MRSLRGLSPQTSIHFKATVMAATGHDAISLEETELLALASSSTIKRITELDSLNEKIRHEGLE